MNQKRWIILPLILASFLTFLFFALSVRTSARPIEGRTLTITPTLTPTNTLTPFPTKPVFTATMQVIPEKTLLTVGEQMDVNLTIDVSEGCYLAVLELNLTQSGENAPLFSYVSPFTDTILSPGLEPYTFTVRAEYPGTVNFNGLAYGERHCFAWVWTYVGASSVPVTVIQRQNYLPVILK